VGRLSPRSAGPHVAAAGIFAALAVAWTYPLVTALSSTIPGLPGDNLAFLWNVWWAREALAAGHDPLFTPLLFAPVGIDLTQNTHTLLPALGAAVPLGRLSPAAALNLIVLCALALSGLLAYALGWRVTRHWPAALACGLVFGGSPFIAARLQGHFNLIHAWTLPLFAIVLLRWLETGARRRAALAGAVAGLTVYVDYYFALCQIGMAAVLAVWEWRAWTFTGPSVTTRRWRAASALAVAAGLAFGFAAAVALTGGFETRIAGVRRSILSRPPGSSRSRRPSSGCGRGCGWRPGRLCRTRAHGGPRPSLWVRSCSWRCRSSGVRRGWRWPATTSSRH
jgi:hypothetical protein